MPEVITIRPKGVFITLEVSLDEAELLRNAMRLCQVNYNGKVQKERQASEYFTEFYDFIDKIVEDLANGP